MMEPDWKDVEAKARVMKAASVEVIKVASAINRGSIAGRPLHPDTLAGLKTVDAPAARDAALIAWNDLKAAATS